MSKKIVRRCLVCGTQFSTYPSQGKKFCSLSCRFSLSLMERFESKVDRNGPTPSHCPGLGPCEIWIGSRSDSGYGTFWVGSRVMAAHRVAFFIAYGRWPKPQALHKCDNRACVRVAHLFEGTNADNVADMIRKGRADHSRQPLGEEHGNAKLTSAGVVAIRNAAAAGESLTSIARRTAVSRATIGDAVHRRTWNHIR